MNESYVECLVAKKPSSAMKALQVFLIVLAVIFFLLSMLNALMWLGVAAAGISINTVNKAKYTNKSEIIPNR